MKNILLVGLYPQKSSNQLALWYLKAYLLKYATKPLLVNIPILVFPLSFENNIESVLMNIYSHRPDIIGFSCYVWNIEPILRIGSLIRKLIPKTKIVLGGPEASPRALELLKNNSYLDVVVKGEGEETFKELADFFLFRKGNIRDIKGIAYRNSGKVINNNPKREIKDLDTIPSPYLENVADIRIDGEVPLETARGCIYKCHYCYYHKEFSSVRFFSLQRIENELKLLLDKQARNIYIMDPTFNINKDRAKRILRIIIENNKNSHLHVELKAELLDEEIVDLLYKAKTSFVEIGLQSTNKETLGFINRDFSPRAFKKNINLLNNKKIRYELQLIDGLPGDGYCKLKKSLDWLFDLHPAIVRIMRFSLLPGTYMRRKAKHFKIKYNPNPPYHCIESNTYSFKDLIKTQRLRTAMSILYDRGLMRKSLYIMRDGLKISPTRIFEEWISWVAGRYVISGGYLLEEQYLDPIERFVVLTKFSDSIYDFIRYMCRKYDSPEAIRKISAQVRYDQIGFLRNNRFDRVKKEIL